MIIQYTHPKLDSEIRAPSGSYLPQEEHTLPYNGREVMYVSGLMVIETSCCGIGSWQYIQTPGFLVKRGEISDKNDSPVSEIDTIQNEKDRTAVYKLLEQKYPGARIEIW
jgi:hypothetical protein